MILFVGSDRFPARGIVQCITSSQGAAGSPPPRPSSTAVQTHSNQHRHQGQRRTVGRRSE